MIRLLCLSLSVFFCLNVFARAARPQSGVWRFELEYPSTKIPFVMELEPTRKGFRATLVNGRERLDLGLARVEKGVWTYQLQTYQNYLEFTQVSARSIKGFFVKATNNPVEKVPFTATPGPIHRFDRPTVKASINLNGKWAMELQSSDGKKTPAIILFDQAGDTLNASILTPTGDYRYIDGHVSGNEFVAAAFDGVYHFTFKGKLEGETLTGSLAGKSVTHFSAKKDPQAQLPDPLKQTQIEQVSFKFSDVLGKEYSLEDFKGKPVVLQIFGSWCPNCIDELDFLGPWYIQNRKRGVEIIALSFEYAATPEQARRHLKKVIEKRNIPYTVLLAGTSRADKPEDKLPSLKNFISFPTTIFLDRNHRVKKVHAGFNGPSTGLYYSEFKAMFEKSIDELTAD
jgi:thiol-disulfide isomerase/thioredoxin